MADKVSDNIIFTSMEIMFNNSHFSDIVFVVNNSKYYAQRFLLSVTSDVFSAMLTKEFKEAHQNEIIIPDVKHDKSFYYILSYIYGMKIDFSSLNMEILCEIIGMAEYYHLPLLYTSVKTYLNSIKKFDHKSIDVVLNTAELYKLDVFYTNCKNYILQDIFVFLHSTALTSISYEVLLDLIKSLRSRKDVPETLKLKLIFDWFIYNKQEIIYFTNEETVLDSDEDEENINFEEVKEVFFATILPEIDFKKICVTDHFNLFKSSDRYTQYEPIVRNFNLNIESINEYNTQLSQEEIRNVGDTQFSFTFKDSPRSSIIKYNGADWFIFIRCKGDTAKLLLLCGTTDKNFSCSVTGTVKLCKPEIFIPFYVLRFNNKHFTYRSFSQLSQHFLCEMPLEYQLQDTIEVDICIVKK